MEEYRPKLESFPEFFLADITVEICMWGWEGVCEDKIRIFFLKERV